MLLVAVTVRDCPPIGSCETSMSPGADPEARQEDRLRGGVRRSAAGYGDRVERGPLVDLGDLT